MNTKEKFEVYANMVREWQSRLNLVSRNTLDDIETRHIADSVQLADFIPKDVAVVDMGSGAGFPAVILAILGWNVIAIESITKKCEFLNAVKDALGLVNLTVYNGRLENYLKDGKIDKNTVFSARAFASLEKIMDYTRNIKKARYFLLKGAKIDQEIKIAQKKYKFSYELIPSNTGDGFVFIGQK